MMYLTLSLAFLSKCCAAFLLNTVHLRDQFTTTMTKRFIVFVFLLISLGAIAQEKRNLTLEDIWASRTFFPKSVNEVEWMKDGRFYTALEENKIEKYDVTTGKKVATILDGNNLNQAGLSKLEMDGYSFSADEKKLLISTETEPIYRRSSKSEYYLYDIVTGALSKLSDGGPQSYATYSPDGKWVAFARNNNLFLVDAASGKEVAITTTGKMNEIIHGSCDWVYEEEFEFAQAFFWSGDSRKIAFYSFDERKVPVFNMQTWGPLYPKDYFYKYPKAGESNSKVDILVFDVPTRQTLQLNIGSENDQYIARVNWTKDPNLLAVRRMNRLQNKIELIHANATTGALQTVLTETSSTYIDINDDLTYLNDGKSFIWMSELAGYKHLFLYNMQGKLVRQITNGNWEIAQFKGIDEKKKLLYYTSHEKKVTEQNFYSIGLDGKNKKLLVDKTGTTNVNISPDYQYFICYFSNMVSPATITLHKSDGTQLKVLENNAEIRKNLEGIKLGDVEFFSFNTSEKVQLNGWMIKPSGFNENTRYPVLMHVYGGPGHQSVVNQWGGPNYLWHQYLAQQGYLVVCVDNRGTGGRGNDFKKVTYANLGKLEITDQIETAKFLGTQKFVDKSRIGIWGWSFGGYMTSLALTVGADYFKAGIAVAPVTNWRYYDSIYTERFLKTPQENPAGYDDNSPVTHAAKLKGAYLLVHGTGDDNVHFQNAVAMQNALIKANKQFTSFFYPNRNHGIYGGNTRLHLYTMMSDFVLKNL